MNHLIGVLGSYKSSIIVSAPPVTSGLQLWLDGSDPLATGVAPSNGTSITSWKDKSGNGAHATSAGTCVYQSSSKSIGLTSGSYSNSTISSGTFNSAIFIFAVYKGKGSGTYNPLIDRSRASYNVGHPGMYNNTRCIMTGAGAYNLLTSSYNVDNSSSTINIFGFSMNQSTNNISEWSNGTANTITGTYTLPVNMDNANNFDTIYIGTRGDGQTGPFTGNFYEILIYNTALTSTQRQDIEGYLAWKWGLQTQLPSTHPYYNSGNSVPAPTTVTMGAYTAGATTISVSWNSVSGIASYTVKFYYNTTATTTGGTLFQTFTNVSSGATSQASSTVLANNTYYYATVAGVNSSGSSSPEQSSSATIQTSPTAPTTVTMGAYTAGATTISVSWSAITGASSYTVKFYSNATATTTGGTLFQTFTGVTATSQASSTTLVANTYYYATVTTINSVGSSSEQPSSATIQTAAAGALVPLTGTVTTIAGTGVTTFNGDGNALSTNINNNYGVAVDSTGNVYFTESNHLIRKITGTTVTTIAGTAGTRGFNGDGDALSTNLYFPYGIALDSTGNVYFADVNNHRIRKLTGTTITTIAGTGSITSNGDGDALSTNINTPFAVAVDSAGIVYFAERYGNRIRKIIGTTVATITTAGAPTGVAVDSSGNVYYTDGTRIRKIIGGTVTTIAGTSSSIFNGDGNVLTTNIAPIGLALDSERNVYFTEHSNQLIRKITGTTVTTIAGTRTAGFNGDGNALSTNLSGPWGIAVDSSGIVYFTDTSVRRIRKIT